MLGVDKMASLAPGWSPYRYAFCNPIMYTDPTGNYESTDVVKNDDGSYKVVGAQNDGDNNIYVRESENGKRTGEIIGQTENPWDFMLTNDQTGEFKGHAEVSFDLEKIPNGNGLIDRLSREWDEFAILSRMSYISTPFLAKFSKNGGPLDVKSWYNNSYTAMKYNGNITTVRTVGNILFGMNMRAINKYSVDQFFNPKEFYYNSTMREVGAYNQSQNNGNGYNLGSPFYGEHTYSGTSIYQGYFGKKP